MTPPATPPQLSVAEGGVQGGPAPAPGVVAGEGGSCYPDLSLPITSTYLRQLRHRDTSLAQDTAAGPDMEDEDEVSSPQCLHTDDNHTECLLLTLTTMLQNYEAQGKLLQHKNLHHTSYNSYQLICLHYFCCWSMSSSRGDD